MCEPVPNQPFTLVAPFYHVWADFWIDQGKLVPPIQRYKYDMRHGITIVIPMGAPEVEPFLKHMKDSEQWVVEGQGSSLLDDKQFVGHWSAISVSLREPSKTLMREPFIRDKKRKFQI